ncbi:putative integral membrane protein [Babesia bovis T2Bo]|uniref:putative integral membrane protein n=1 Tax=Babesia bovis T2Bo TaxID=484906 RepID=UPI001C35F3D6|nr:putative integral membrane protein [Babesia bovis T2Bo]KAG6440054.1 putative integral membrane protein [Babesia bovis T2Bo]
MAGELQVLLRQGQSRLLMLLCLLIKIVAAETEGDTDDAENCAIFRVETRYIKYLLYAAICGIVVMIGFGIAGIVNQKSKDYGPVVGIGGAIFVGIAIFCMYRLGYFDILRRKITPVPKES